MDLSVAFLSHVELQQSLKIKWIRPLGKEINFNQELMSKNQALASTETKAISKT